MTAHINKTDLLKELSLFTGTLTYTKLYPNVVLTDGACYLASTVGCYWLFDLFYSQLVLHGDCEEFACLILKVSSYSASVEITDGNDKVLARQKIEYTDFPLEGITIFACQDGTYWVMMLPSEY